MRYLIPVLVLVPALAFGQLKVSYAPQSVIGWGTTPTASMISMKYGPVGLLYMSTDAPLVTDTYQNHLVQSVAGIFAVPFQFEMSFFNASAGAVLFNKKVPTKTGTRFNFRLAAGVHLNREPIRLGIEYAHISNAWTGRINPGWDFPTMNLGIQL